MHEEMEDHMDEVVHGIVSVGPFSMDSIKNFFCTLSAGQAIVSAQSSTAFLGLMGLNVKSLAYSFKR